MLSKSLPSHMSRNETDSLDSGSNDHSVGMMLIGKSIVRSWVNICMYNRSLTWNSLIRGGGGAAGNQ